jgi:transposase
MGLLNIIRRMALRDELPIREVSRRTGLSRNTIKKYLNAGTVEPKFATPARPGKLGPFAEKLSAWLKIGSRQVAQAAPDAEAASCRSGGSRLHRFLQSGRRLCPVLAHGSPAGAADDGARHLRPPGLSRRRGVPVRLERGLCGPRRAHQAADRPYQAVAQPGLPAPRLSAPNPRDAVRCSLAWVSRFRRRAGRGIYDNMRTAVDRVGRGKERRVNIRFLAMTNHYVSTARQPADPTSTRRRR